MYRTVDCATWDDPWFAELDPNAKLLFLYLLTNRRATACGAFEITLRAMAFETGLSTADITAALTTLAPKIQWWSALQVAWVRNFYKHQRANSNEKFATSARRALAEFPSCVQHVVGSVYPELLPDPTPPSPNGHEWDTYPTTIPLDTHTNKETVTETVTVTETKQEQDREREPLPAPPAPTKPPRKVSAHTVPKPKQATVPDDWPLTDALLEWWDAQHAPPGIDAARETEKWQDYHRQKGTRVSDWAASWRNWMRKSIEYYQPPASRNGSTSHATSQRQPDKLTGKLGGIANYVAGLADESLEDPGRDRHPNVAVLRARTTA